ncbi:hypothetical protein I8752_21705 [Nostocaceae cyanobacterium CENA369]|uniref:Uncharacterized protein n=1 Tax=Dendronalium phyllosphericum CENA369 TaxID=1725256 RepID=A0A8J7I639_9NOST|nr:hypothetical protein [Dendronalium phyllosphericum]MBH8575575.1 hypothetical protein [Dendronalium phyllosphericum CENA369]
MFTRSELEIKTIQELRNLCRRYGIKPTGNPGYKTSFITSLMAFPYLALQQMQEHRGLKPPSFANLQYFASALDEIGIPTDEQSALIRITMEGRMMSYPERYEQSQLMNLYKAKLRLEQVIHLLNQ